MQYIKRFDPKAVSNERLISELKFLAKQLGRTPSSNDMKKYGKGLVQKVHLYRQRFGSLNKAQEASGLIKNLGGKDLKYDEKDLLDEIIALKEKLGRTPTQEDLRKYSKYPAGAYKRHFGTYNRALNLLKLKPNERHDWKPEEIKQDIIRISKILKRTPTVDEFVEYSQTTSAITACHKISNSDSWNKTLKKCGLPILNNRDITDQELKDEILRLKEKSGKIPGYYEMSQEGIYCPETYALRFGSYVKALHHFGFNYIPQNQWHNQTYTKGKDGILYKSQFEAYAGNILYSLKQNNIITNYVYEKRVCRERQWTCDFYIETGIKNLWLEMDGMGKNRKDAYNEDNEKIEYYLKNNYNYCIIDYGKKELKQYIDGLLRKLRCS